MDEFGILSLEDAARPGRTIDHPVGTILLITGDGRPLVAMRARASFAYREESVVYLSGPNRGSMVPKESDKFPDHSMPINQLVDLGIREINPGGDYLLKGTVSYSRGGSFLQHETHAKSWLAICTLKAPNVATFRMVTKRLLVSE